MAITVVTLLIQTFIFMIIILKTSPKTPLHYMGAAYSIRQVYELFSLLRMHQRPYVTVSLVGLMAVGSRAGSPRELKGRLVD